MRHKIIAENKEHLKELIKNEMNTYGQECDLNHINVSKVTDMSSLFYKSYFNGNISEWDVSNVEDMSSMFLGSYFNGNLSKWDVSNVKNMSSMFLGPHFYGDLSDWKPYKLERVTRMFTRAEVVPYWVKFGKSEERRLAIDSYHLNKELNEKLTNTNPINPKKVKI